MGVVTFRRCQVILHHDQLVQHLYRPVLYICLALLAQSWKRKVGTSAEVMFFWLLFIDF